ncbi:MAG: lysine 2,3-aminomutase, partial [Anaerolineaceae bacterium]|nr:lysine 2,3-aminomutase [Anaerolineaceae bacterium]
MRTVDSSAESEGDVQEPPGTSGPPHPWEDVPLEKWQDWRWQLAHRLNTVEELSRVIRLTPDEIEGLSAPGHFRVDITPYFASLMDAGDPHCPIRRQVIPTGRERVPYTAEMVDSLAEDAHSPVPGLVHRYPDRVLMLVTTQCASYCRYCTRSRIVGDPGAQFSRRDYDAQIRYIAGNPEVRDVLLSGGDPLTLPPAILEDLLRRLRAIPHVEVLRIGTRVPCFLPQRITPELVEMLRQYHPLWMNIHFNHPKEITPEVEVALARLADAGIPLGCQSVLLAGVNDCPNVFKELVHKLVRNRVRPYYIYQCDLVHGAGHFRTPVAVGIEIIESLRGHTSGFAVPTFVIDAPKGGGKVPVMPNYLVSQSADRVVVRNFEGFMSAYTQPETYERHDAAHCSSCQRQRAVHDEDGQEGVAALLHGEQDAIVPEGFDIAHQRLTRIRWAPIKARIALRVAQDPALRVAQDPALRVAQDP